MRSFFTAIAFAAVLGGCGAGASPARSTYPEARRAPAHERVQPLPRRDRSADEELLIEDSMGLH